MSHRPSSSTSVPPIYLKMGECVYMCGWMVMYIWNGQEYMEILSAWLFPGLIPMLLLLTVCMLTPTCMVVGVKCGQGQGQLVGYGCRTNIQQPTRAKMPYELKWIVQFLLQECTSRDLRRQLSTFWFQIWYVLMHPKDFLLEHALSTKSPAKGQIGKTQSVNCSQ